jgi:hypothetical protein
MARAKTLGPGVKTEKKKESSLLLACPACPERSRRARPEPAEGVERLVDQSYLIT